MGGGGGWGNLECIINVGIKCVVHGMVNVACCVVVVLLEGEGGNDFYHLLLHVRDDGSAVCS